MQPKILCIGVSAVYVAVMVCPNVQFYTKCAVLILICALLTAHLSAGADCAPLSLLAGFWGGEEKGGKAREGKWKEKRKKREGRKWEKDKGKKGEKRRRKGRNFVQLLFFLRRNSGRRNGVI